MFVGDFAIDLLWLKLHQDLSQIPEPPSPQLWFSANLFERRLVAVSVHGSVIMGPLAGTVLHIHTHSFLIGDKRHKMAGRKKKPHFQMNSGLPESTSLAAINIFYMLPVQTPLFEAEPTLLFLSQKPPVQCGAIVMDGASAGPLWTPDGPAELSGGESTQPGIKV